MKKYQILYDWAKAEISRLSEDEFGEPYSTTLDSTRESMFVSLTEDIRALLAELTDAEASRIHFASWAQLRQKVADFAHNFPDFPDANYDKLNVFFILSTTLSATGIILDEEEIDDQLFEVRSLSLSLPLNWMARENRTTFENSLVVLSRGNCKTLRQTERTIMQAHFVSAFS